MILYESITTLKLINLCIHIDVKSIQNFKNLRRIFFQNGTIQFMASSQQEDYDFYPKNLSRWSFNRGQTDSFDQFIKIINELGKWFLFKKTSHKYSLLEIKGPLKFDIKLSNCFRPIYSFNHFIPLDTQLIFLDITCENFQVDEPFDVKTRGAIFLTPTLMINTESKLCPSIHKYRWLSLKHSHTKLFSLRIFICENRHIDLNFDINETTIQNVYIPLTKQNTNIQSINIPKRWTLSIIINFFVAFLSTLIICVAFIIFCIHYLKNKSNRSCRL